MSTCTVGGLVAQTTFLLREAYDRQYVSNARYIRVAMGHISLSTFRQPDPSVSDDSRKEHIREDLATDKNGSITRSTDKVQARYPVQSRRTKDEELPFIPAELVVAADGRLDKNTCMHAELESAAES